VTDLTPEQRSRIYEEEKARLDAQRQIRSEQRNNTASTLGIGCLAVLGVLFFVLIILGSLGNSENATVADSVVFHCPPAGCEVATDSTAMMIIVMHETDAPDDDGIFDSAARTRAYRDALTSGKILFISEGTRALRKYRTPPDPSTPARYSVLGILDGPLAGQRVLVRDRYLK
jgi:hypothetical protein